MYLNTHKKFVITHLHVLLTICCCLVIIGLIFIYSASSIYALEKFGGAHYFIKKQLLGLLIGISALFIVNIATVETIKKFTPHAFICSCLFVGLPLLTSHGRTINGARRWAHVGAVVMQPSEFFKIIALLYFAYFLSKHEQKLYSLRYGYIPFFTILSLCAGILLAQPDFGMACTLSLTGCILFFTMHLNYRHIISTFFSAILLCWILITKYPYRMRRIMTFLNPWQDPHGAGFQVIQSLIAIGSGNFFGTGVSHSKQKFFYLPMAHTDFIIAIIAEEIGFFGIALIIFLYAMFLYIGMRIAWQLKNTFSALFVIGFVVLINTQAIINIAVACGMLPTKGTGLPFISYGNSSLISSLLALGIIINMVRAERRQPTPVINQFLY